MVGHATYITGVKCDGTTYVELPVTSHKNSFTHAARPGLPETELGYEYWSRGATKPKIA